MAQPGVEPGSLAYEASVGPFHYRAMFLQALPPPAPGDYHITNSLLQRSCVRQLWFVCHRPQPLTSRYRSASYVREAGVEPACQSDRVTAGCSSTGTSHTEPVVCVGYARTTGSQDSRAPNPARFTPDGGSGWQDSNLRPPSSKLGHLPG